MKKNLLPLEDLLETYKYMTAMSKNVYIDKLDNIFDKQIIHTIEKSKRSLLM